MLFGGREKVVFEHWVEFGRMGICRGFYLGTWGGLMIV